MRFNNCRLERYNCCADNEAAMPPVVTSEWAAAVVVLGCVS